jgi:uncharacterized protein (DUF983 family)
MFDFLMSRPYEPKVRVFRARACAGPSSTETRIIVTEMDKLGVSPPPVASRREPWPAIIAGLRGKCPACGSGRMFRAYLKVVDTCPSCGEELHHHRADDAPPYFTILVVGHVVGALMLLTEELWPESPIWFHALVWPTLVVVLSLWLLPLFKGALVAYQWALRMHGFETAGEAVTGEAAAETLRSPRP